MSVIKITYCTWLHQRCVCFRKGGQDGSVLCHWHRQRKDKVPQTNCLRHSKGEWRSLLWRHNGRVHDDCAGNLRLHRRCGEWKGKQTCHSLDHGGRHSLRQALWFLHVHGQQQCVGTAGAGTDGVGVGTQSCWWVLFLSHVFYWGNGDAPAEICWWRWWCWWWWWWRWPWPWLRAFLILNSDNSTLLAHIVVAVAVAIVVVVLFIIITMIVSSSDNSSSTIILGTIFYYSCDDFFLLLPLLLPLL